MCKRPSRKSTVITQLNPRTGAGKALCGITIMTRKLKDDTPGVRDSARGAEGLCKNEVDPSRKRGPGKAPSLPRALKPLMDRDQWLVWRLERNKQGKDTKVPYQANHPERKASTKNSETWASYAV